MKNKKGFIQFSPIIIWLALIVLAYFILRKASNGYFVSIMIGITLGAVFGFIVPKKIYATLLLTFSSIIALYHFYISNFLLLPDFPAGFLVGYAFAFVTSGIITLLKFMGLIK